MNRNYKAKDPLLEIKEGIVYNWLKYGSLYAFFVVWNMINLITARTFVDIVRVRVRGYKDLSEQRKLQPHIKKIGLPKLLIFTSFVLVMNIYFIYFDFTRQIFLSTTVMFCLIALGLKMLNINLMDLLF